MLLHILSLGLTKSKSTKHDLLLRIKSPFRKLGAFDTRICTSDVQFAIHAFPMFTALKLSISDPKYVYTNISRKNVQLLRFLKESSSNGGINFTKKFRQIKSMPQIMLTLLNAACSHIYKNATAFTTSARSKVSDYAGMLENCQMEIIVTAKGLLYTLTSKNLHTPTWVNAQMWRVWKLLSASVGMSLVIPSADVRNVCYHLTSW